MRERESIEMLFGRMRTEEIEDVHGFWATENVKGKFIRTWKL